MAPIVMNIPEWETQLNLIKHPQQQRIMDYLVNGADIGITATHNKPRHCHNLISAQGTANMKRIEQEMDKETSLGRRAGPFRQMPFYNFQCSPIGTVPKN